MFTAISRAATVGLPWLAVMAVSIGLGYGMDVALTNGVPVTTPVEESVSGVIARSDITEGCVGSGWMVYVGLNTWMRDPSRVASCRDESAPGR